MNHDAISAGARQFQRHETQYHARLEPHPDHADQFRLSYSGFSDDLAVVDVSAGGLALHSCFLVPRNMRFAITVIGVKSAEGQALGDITVRAIARRCTLVDHKPTYQVGLQFIDPTGTDEQVLVRFVTKAQCQTSLRAAEAAGVC